MKKLITLFSLMAALLVTAGIQSCTQAHASDLQSNVASAASERTVYVCTGDGARCYHFDRNCRGLGRCGCPVISMSESEAMTRKAANGQNLKVCGICGKHNH